MTGYADGHEAVEFYKGTWILRAAIQGDLPLIASDAAVAAMQQWRSRNAEKFKTSEFA